MRDFRSILNIIGLLICIEALAMLIPMCFDLYYGNYETAREIEGNTKKEFPDEAVKLSFETPNYKVQMGPYRGFKKSNDLLKNVKKIYPAAFLIEPKKNL